MGPTEPPPLARESALIALESLNRLADMTLTLSATILGFSIIFLTSDTKTFNHPEYLQYTWLCLAVALTLGILSRISGYGFYISMTVGNLAVSDERFDKAVFRGKFFSFFNRSFLWLGLIALAGGLIFLLVFGWQNLN